MLRTHSCNLQTNSRVLVNVLWLLINAPLDGRGHTEGEREIGWGERPREASGSPSSAYRSLWDSENTNRCPLTAGHPWCAKGLYLHSLIQKFSLSTFYGSGLRLRPGKTSESTDVVPSSWGSCSSEEDGVKTPQTDN